jgi:hypothetical protein
MKKLIATIIIFLILGIAVAIVGLIYIPGNMYGVAYSSFSGFDKKILFPGSVSWRWEKLIPTIFTTYVFDLSPYKIDNELIIKGDYLLAGSGHTNLSGESISFDTGVKYMLEFSIIPEKLQVLVVSGLRPEKLSDWYSEKSQALSARISEVILKDPAIFREADFTAKISSIIKDDPQFDPIKIKSIAPSRVNLPDYDLYMQLKQKTMEVEKLRLEAETEKINAEKERDLLAIKKEIDIIQNLDRYGETFKNYPILLEFLYLRNLKPEEFIKLSEVNFSKGK